LRFKKSLSEPIIKSVVI